jgi:hypothetical protein
MRQGLSRSSYLYEKDERSAYYWLRLAEQNAKEILRSSGSLLHELKQKINAEDIQQIESTVASDTRQGPQLDRLTTLQKENVQLDPLKSRGEPKVRAKHVNNNREDRSSRRMLFQKWGSGLS